MQLNSFGKKESTGRANIKKEGDPPTSTVNEKEKHKAKRQVLNTRAFNEKSVKSKS